MVIEQNARKRKRAEVPCSRRGSQERAAAEGFV